MPVLRHVALLPGVAATALSRRWSAGAAHRTPNPRPGFGWRSSRDTRRRQMRTGPVPHPAFAPRRVPAVWRNAEGTTGTTAAAASPPRQSRNGSPAAAPGRATVRHRIAVACPSPATWQSDRGGRLATSLGQRTGRLKKNTIATLERAANLPHRAPPRGWPAMHARTPPEH